MIIMMLIEVAFYQEGCDRRWAWPLLISFLLGVGGCLFWWEYINIGIYCNILWAAYLPIALGYLIIGLVKILSYNGSVWNTVRSSLFCLLFPAFSFMLDFINLSNPIVSIAIISILYAVGLIWIPVVWMFTDYAAENNWCNFRSVIYTLIALIVSTAMCFLVSPNESGAEFVRRYPLFIIILCITFIALLVKIVYWRSQDMIWYTIWNTICAVAMAIMIIFTSVGMGLVLIGVIACALIVLSWLIGTKLSNG